MTPSLEEQIKAVAFNNGMKFKVGAALVRNNEIISITCCSLHKDKRWSRINGYHGQVDTTTHAEMAALVKAEPGDCLVVMRWRASGELTMAHPCPFCLRLSIKKSISTITYSDWNGQMQTLNTTSLTTEDLDWWSQAYYKSKPRVPRWH